MSQPDDKAPPLSARRGLLELKRRITSITKDGHNPQGDFAFRGIDQVMNAAGPIERELGLLVLPQLVSEATEQVEYGAKRTLAFRTRVQVAYTWLGEDGTTLPVGPFPGEAMDSGDKGTAKAMSVALRTMYLQVLTVPTGETDPDASTYELSRPESETTDPVVEKKLRDRIMAAATEPVLRKAYDAVLAEFGGEKATISVATRDELIELCRTRLAELAPEVAAKLEAERDRRAAAERKAKGGSAAGGGPEARRSAATNAAGVVHPAAADADATNGAPA